MRVSVVICEHTLERYDDCHEAARSVLAQTHDDVELVLVSDGNEEVYERFRADFGDRDDVSIHCNDENVGLLESRNNGAELATGDVVAFLDDDAVADERWVAELVSVYEADEKRLAAGGRMIPRWVAGKPTFLPEEFYWLVGVTHKGFGPDGNPDVAGELRNTFGSNISFDREVFLELGGFEEDIGGRQRDKNLQGGETELCARLRDKHGTGVYYSPEALVAHKVFEYRTNPRWLIDRAFWQGYSKRGMEVFVPESTGDESDFLRDLLSTFVPRRAKKLIASPTLSGLLQFLMLFIFTGVVSLGYLYGATKYGGSVTNIEPTTEPEHRVLWLRPSMGDHISVRRTRIAEKLAERGIEADIRDSSGLDSLAAIRTAIEGNYDVIIGNVRIGLYLGYPLARLLGKPFIGDVSDPLSDFEDLPWPLFRLLSAYEWFVLERADACAFTYEESKEAADWRGIAGKKLPNAVDYDLFSDPDPDAVTEASDILSEEGVDLSKPIAVYIGGMIEETYHLTDIIDAAKHCRAWEFVFIGDGPQKDLVEDAAESIDNVYFPGAFEYRLMPGFLAHATAGFCLKDAEQPLKIAEYGAAGLVGIVQPGELGKRFSDDEVLISDANGSALAESLTSLDDEQVRKSYSENLRRRAKSISWEDISAEYAEMIFDLVD